LSDENEELENVKLKNDASESEVDNLISLPYLHEPAILFCLQQRYSLSDIYTYTGPILIAMNPFKKVPLYTNQILEVYYNEGLLKSQGIETGTHLPPHVYAIADAAYREMMRVIMSGYGGGSGALGGGISPKGGANAVSANNSILISGESGAGKTESTKIVLRYLTTVGNSTGDMAVESGSVMDKILQSNPILEAFGNARTLRNDNSSRFGKFIELSFNKRGHLIGGLIRTYLLEKVRLPSQQRGERNFHIFYQLAAGASEEERARWGIESIEQFEYAQHGGVFQLQSMDDREEFGLLKHAFDILNFPAADSACLLDMTAALLHLGQVAFRPIYDKEGEGSAIAEDAESRESLALAAQLLGLEVAQVVRTLTVRAIVARDDTYEKKLTALQASDARDAMAKAIYGKVFDWIVTTINRSIVVDAKLVRSSIGVLDIFGFECFTHNSFEQLCINYTNETLQQQFNQYIFKMEQIEYQKEKIEWSFIEFPDNQDCLDLIEHKVSGILAMIDDECRLGQASDEKLASRMYKAYEKNERFMATAPHKRDHKFCIRHYAGAVVYSAITFVEKNKDEVPKEATTLLQSSSLGLLSALFSEAGASASAAGAELGKATSRRDMGGGAAGVGTGKTKGSTISAVSVGTQFKEQLSTLMASIYATTPHYIRCLKPNDENVSDSFNRLRITEQLRYGGVLEAVRVARSGFPVRLTHLDFYARYRALANPYCALTKSLPAFCHKEKVTTEAMKVHCDNLISALWDESGPDAEPSSANAVQDTETGMVRGEDGTATRVRMSKRRSRLADLSIWQSKSTIAKQSVQLGLTKVFLRKPAHDVLESRRSRRITSAARRIQSQFRCQQIRSWYHSMQRSARLVQRLMRGVLARIRVTAMRRLVSALKIQRQYRRYVHQSRYWVVLNAVAMIQCKYRSVRATRLVTARRHQVHSVQLQRVMRGLYYRRRWFRFRRAVVVLQNRSRKAKARAQLRELRIAAKDVGKLKQSNDDLKNEIEALRARAAEEKERMRQEMEKALALQTEAAKEQEFNGVKSELDNAFKLLEIEKALHAQVESRCAALEAKLRAAQEQLAAEKQNVADRDVALQNAEILLVQNDEALRSANARIAYLERGEIAGPESSVEGGGGVGSWKLQKQSMQPSVGSGKVASMRRASAAEEASAAAAAGMAAAAAAGGVGSLSHSNSSGAMSANGGGAGGSLSIPVPGYSRRNSRNSISSVSSSVAATSPVPPGAVAAGAGGDRRRTSIRAASAAASSPVSLLPEEERFQLQQIIERETSAREALEAEVTRLRRISIDYRAEIDSLQRLRSSNSGGAYPPATPAAAHSAGAGAGGGRAVYAAPTPHPAASLLSTAAGGATSSKLRRAPLRRGSAAVGAPSTGAGAYGGRTLSGTSATPIPQADLQKALRAWDAGEEEDEGEGDDDESGSTNDMLSQGSSTKSTDQQIAVQSNPLVSTRTQANMASTAATHSAAAAAAAKTLLSNPQELASTVGTFEKNIEDFRHKLRAVCLLASLFVFCCSYIFLLPRGP
jgi:myosin V